MVNLNSDLLSINNVSVLIRGQTTDTPVTTAPTVVYNATDTTIQLIKSDMNKIYIINNSSPVRINLPENIITTDFGIWIIIHKSGSGNLSIYASNNTSIEDSTNNGYIINNVSEQVWANIGIFLAKTDQWKFLSAPLGTWTTV
jgi:hypothetical protein